MNNEEIPSVEAEPARATTAAGTTIAASAPFPSPWSGAAARNGRQQLGERRRQVDPTTCEKDYSDEEIVFMKAMDQYKGANRRPFPTWSEVLEVLRSLGYRKTEDAAALPGLPTQPKPQGA